MSAPTTVTSHRLVVPVPDAGWLRVFGPAGRAAALSVDWQLMTDACVRAARLPELGTVFGLVTFRPRFIAKVGDPGIHVAEDLRPSWHVVRDALAEAGVEVVRERLVLGVPAVDPLVTVELGRVPDVR